MLRSATSATARLLVRRQLVLLLVLARRVLAGHVIAAAILLDRYTARRASAHIIEAEPYDLIL